MNEFLTFRKMITPVIIQILFWVGVAVAVIGGIVGLARGDVSGIFMILLGPVLVRIYCEILIVMFRILEGIQQIAQNTGGQAGTQAPPGAQTNPFGAGNIQ